MNETAMSERGLYRIRRALLSVTDKSGLVELATILCSFGCELVASGGTASTLTRAGLPVIEISSFTGTPEAFQGRMKTISFEVAAGILFHRERDREEAERLNVKPIDLVVANFYQFDTMAGRTSEIEKLVEFIDIGGPTMVRAAAKNFSHVAVIVDPADYDRIIRELQTNSGALSLETRAGLARKALAATARYDALISAMLCMNAGERFFWLPLRNGFPLRYGENPHQRAELFFSGSGNETAEQPFSLLSGPELSYNNILDLHSAIEAASFGDGKELLTCAIVKHNNPCGLASGPCQRRVFELAWEGDPVSSYGAVVAFNSPVSRDTVSFLSLDSPDRSGRKYIEVIAAPSFSEEAYQYLSGQKKLRIVRFSPVLLNSSPPPSPGTILEHITRGELDSLEIRSFGNVLLVQEKDRIEEQEFKLVTETASSLFENKRLMLFGLHAVRSLKSNAIAIIRSPDSKGNYFQLAGMGAGQPSRVTATKIAIEKALANTYRYESSNMNYISCMQIYDSSTEPAVELPISGTPAGRPVSPLEDCILFSDAFFPFPDSIELAAKAGIRAIVQPGGSIRDHEIINAANRLKLSMVFTGRRHFRH